MGHALTRATLSEHDFEFEEWIVGYRVASALDKKNAALLTGAYFADEIERRHLKPNEVTAESLAYRYNPVVHSFGNSKQYVACEDKLSLAI